MWSSAHCFEVTVHQILAELKISVNFSFPANSFYSLHPIKLKLDLKLDHDVERRIIYQGYSPPILVELCPWNISVNFSFPAISYSLHLIKLKLVS